MTLSFALLAGLTAGSAIAAMSLRNLVHCALSLVVTFAGLAGLFLQLNAEFVGFAQILVYVGAVAILIVFAILLTRGGESAPAPIATATPWAVSIAVALFVTMAGAVMMSPGMARRFLLSAAPPGAPAAFAPPSPGVPSVPVNSLGERLMGEYILPLEVLGLLLTAALIGAVIIAMQEKRK